MSDQQIILLPKQQYFSWVKAAKNYVLKYGPNLTSDPETAARFESPDKTVTIANPPDGYGRNIVAWFGQNAPSLQLDVVNIDTPDEFQQVLEARIANNDQFGTTAQPATITTTTAPPSIPSGPPVLTRNRLGPTPRFTVALACPAMRASISVHQPTPTSTPVPMAKCSA